jgi:hypothetical protein
LVLVTLGQEFLDLGQGLAREFQAEDACLELLVPDRICRRLVRGPVEFAAVDHHDLVLAEVHGFQQLRQARVDLRQARFQSPAIPFVDEEPGVQVTRQQGVVQPGAQALELGDIGFKEDAARAVEVLEIVVEQPTGERVVDRHPRVMVAPQAFDDVQRGKALQSVVAQRLILCQGECRQRQQQRYLKQQGVNETGAELQAFGHLCGRLGNGDDNAGDITDNPSAFHGPRSSGRREFSTPSPEYRACALD